MSHANRVLVRSSAICRSLRRPWRALYILPAFVLTLALVQPARASDPAFLVKDINRLPRNDSSQPQDIVAIGNVGFFMANDGENGNELWKSDGTAAGTTLVKDTQPGAGSDSSGQLTNVNGRLFFTAD